MSFPRFFIDRPIFAIVLSVLMMIAGIVAFFHLPLSDTPRAPPTVQVTASYPGANPQVIAETVAAPLEQVITASRACCNDVAIGDDGRMILTATFARHQRGHGADPGAKPRLAGPAAFARRGAAPGRGYAEDSPDILMVVHLLSPDHVMTALHLQLCLPSSARRAVADPGINDVLVWGGRVQHGLGSTRT